MKRPLHTLARAPGWAAIVACLAAVALALFGAPRASIGAPGVAAPEVSASASGGGGRSPMPGNAAVPLRWMPPGAGASPSPSDEIFPPQTITIRFNHKKHVKELGQSCKTCHPGAYTSVDAADRLLPDPVQACDSCHGVDHTNRVDVKATSGAARPGAAGPTASGACSYCHQMRADGKVAPFVLPTPNLRFSHKKHSARNIQCGQCHGQVAELELATREQLPRMAGCFVCHDMAGAAQGDAKGACTTCHLTQPDGRLKVAFATGPLLPPRWLRASAHDADWIERHKSVAADDSTFCGNCHTSNECVDCHDGRVRPRKVHPDDFLSMHPQAARQDNPRCVSCHQEQTFCADCHRRTGVARDGPSGARPLGRRFHPPPEVWTSAPRSSMHHAWEAMRNLNACVSCHTERDCTTCHATKGLSGGQGVNPHPIGFRSKCSLALRRNPTPCLMCHRAGDRSLGLCR